MRLVCVCVLPPLYLCVRSLVAGFCALNTHSFQIHHLERKIKYIQVQHGAGECEEVCERTSAGVGSKVTLTLLRVLYNINTAGVNKHQDLMCLNMSSGYLLRLSE